MGTETFVCANNHIFMATRPDPAKPTFWERVGDFMDGLTANVNSGVTGVGKSGQVLAQQSMTRRSARIDARSGSIPCPSCTAIAKPLDHCWAEQVAAWLRSRIGEGECPPGHKVAPGQLVPLGTPNNSVWTPAHKEVVQDALEMLADQGVLRREVKNVFVHVYDYSTTKVIEYYMP